jgi:hypothetical protein
MGGSLLSQHLWVAYIAGGWDDILAPEPLHGAKIISKPLELREAGYMQIIFPKGLFGN